jgi:hypothetical protein
MTREGLEHEIACHRGALERLQAITPNCHSCDFFAAGRCRKYDCAVPAANAAVGCDEWRYDDIPF